MLFILSLSGFMWDTSAYGFTRKLVVNYSDKNANNISHVVVTQQKKSIEWIEIEKPFSEVCTAGECIVEVDLDPEAEYEFMVYFKNSAGNGETISCSFKTGKIEPAENNPPIINFKYNKISDTKVLLHGTVNDESHVEVRIPGNKPILNFGYSNFSFEVNVEESTNFSLEAKDIHGNISLIRSSEFNKALNLNTYYEDYDGDGYGNPDTSLESDRPPPDYVTNNTDCNDFDSSIHPGANEIRGDGIDQDCNGSDSPPLITYYYDYDGDGYGNPDTSCESDRPPPDYVRDNTDCNDFDSSIHPGANEIRGDGSDQNCNGSDSPPLITYYYDYDGDGYGNPDTSCESDRPPPDYVTDNTDCNDFDSSIHPGANEIRGDGSDQNCNGSDSPPLITYYYDYDGDGYGNPDTSCESDHPPPDYVTDNTDCNDFDSSIHPGANEIRGDGSDQNCDGSDADIRSIQLLVTQIYVATFERAPAYTGLMYWTNAIDTGNFTIEQVAQSFFDQPETQAKFPEGSSNTEFITTIYYNTLGRAPTAEGLAYWKDALDRGEFRRDQAIMAIINGAKAATGSPEDADMLAKKTDIGIYFANSEIGNLTSHENFMSWARNVISFAISSNFNLKEAKEYIVEMTSFILGLNVVNTF